MQVKVENAGKNVVQLEIEVEAEKFEQGLQKSFIKNAKKFNIPGFRRGKAPRHMVEKFYGEHVLYEDAINEVCPEAYEQAIEEHDINPVDRPEIDIKQIGKGQPLIFTATVTVRPDVELGQYKGVEIEKSTAVVTDEDVEKEIERARERNSRLVTVEDRPAASGDTVTIDFEGFVDGEAFEGGKGTDYELVLGSGTFIPGFEDQLIGAAKGEEKEVNVTFPEEYHSKEMAGKAAVFKVTVKEIRIRELPELDDEFAKDVSEFDTLEEYKADLRKKLLEKAEHNARHENEDKVIEKVVENATVDIPPVMIERHIDNLVNDFAMRLMYQGLDLEKYLEISGMDMNAFREQFKKRAEQEVKTQLVIDKISKVEAIVPTDEDTDGEIRRIAENYRQSEEEFRQHLKPDDIEYIRSTLVARKTVEFLLENAKLK
ncbi:MAG: trigger factor [Acetivibrionales bacterium]|jgi:trigger factor|nr:trigger factor [Bacillota bacterium]NLP07558.1 trigger factor [Clostridiaceae bacterium]HOA55030.1 trigger factor [Clostridiales bacterium]HQD30483.1 trigger factor [Clostridiales bacterium]